MILFATEPRIYSAAVRAQHGARRRRNPHVRAGVAAVGRPAMLASAGVYPARRVRVPALREAGGGRAGSAVGVLRGVQVVVPQRAAVLGDRPVLEALLPLRLREQPHEEHVPPGQHEEPREHGERQGVQPQLHRHVLPLRPPVRREMGRHAAVRGVRGLVPRGVSGDHRRRAGVENFRQTVGHCVRIGVL